MMEFSKAYDRKEFVAFLQNEFLPEDVSFTDDPKAEVQQGTKYIKTISKLGTCPCRFVEGDIPFYGKQARTQGVSAVCACGRQC